MTFMWLHAPNLRATHGFSDRRGGVSAAPFAALNLSANVNDDPAAVAHNRALALEALGLSGVRLARLRQVHSSEVVTVTCDSDPEHLPMADALVTKMRDVALVIETADCYPVLLEDSDAGVIGAAHCGWRGTAGRILERALEAMLALGARPERVQAAIGPGICGAQYAVGAEVPERFATAGFPRDAFLEATGDSSRSDTKQFFVNLERANRWLLTRNGVPEANIYSLGRCSTEEDFFSYRRDQGRTGRMWSVIAKV
jgi:YfiH family protein